MPGGMFEGGISATLLTAMGYDMPASQNSAKFPRSTLPGKEGLGQAALACSAHVPDPAPRLPFSPYREVALPSATF